MVSGVDGGCKSGPGAGTGASVRGASIYLFIYLFVMAAWSPEAMALLKTGKMLGERKNEQPRSHAFPSHKQVQNAKIESGTAVSSAAESRWPSPVLSPSCGHGGLERGFICHKDKPSWLP
jgi:hypothetical protein